MRLSGGSGSWLTVLPGLMRWRQQAEQARQEPGQPGAEQAEVMGRGGEDNVRRVALGAAQEVATKMTVALHVADDRLDGVAAPPLAANGRGDAALLAGDEHPGLV